MVSQSKPALLPVSNSTVKVSIIKTTTRIDGMRTELLFSNPIPGFDMIDDMPAWAFLIEHIPTQTRLLFDLGARIDWKDKAPPAVLSEIEEYGWSVSVEKGIDEILLEHGISTGEIHGIIWSHMHWDHVGDLLLFPSSIPLVVGPGFKKEFLPGWPEDPESTVDSAAWSNERPLVELARLDPDNTTEANNSIETPISGNRLINYLSSAPTLTISSLRALDLFSDGSFYLLSTPGHTPAHLSALARTDDNEYILLAGDAFDNGGQIRPNPAMPLPFTLKEHLEKYAPELLSRTADVLSNGQGYSYSNPFLCPEAEDEEEARRSLEGLMGLDARKNVLTLCSHEKYHLIDEMKYFPAWLNGWRDAAEESGEISLRSKLLWWFLEDYNLTEPYTADRSTEEDE